MKTQTELLDMARDMRAKQRDYYNSRGDKSKLIEAKVAESVFDRALKEYDEHQAAPQQELFGGGGGN